MLTLLFLRLRGHADLVRVREVNRIGNNEADAAAALGRRRCIILLFTLGEWLLGLVHVGTRWFGNFIASSLLSLGPF